MSKQEKNINTGPNPVNLGGLLSCRIEGLHSTPEAYPKTGREDAVRDVGYNGGIYATAVTFFVRGGEGPS